MQNLKLLRDAGVRDAKIASLFQMRVPVVQSPGLRKAVDEVKELGFDPLKWTFVMALVAKVILSEPKWNAKVDALKSWGWSKELIDAAFKRHPRCMLASVDKINAVLSFWVNRLGWNSLDLAMFPVVFGYSLEKRIVPRASVDKSLEREREREGGPLSAGAAGALLQDQSLCRYNLAVMQSSLLTVG
ncbi:hypothetical protein RIF29_04235 [Crotalaria pallida]|uniref:mTERF protein n=1 Tax=Crotalaria pallida TaxID=3830 RepID=A0AAN9P9X7_CROPI